jgi:trypsin
VALLNEVIPKFKYSWIGSIYYKQEFICSASLINKNTILTAAGCSEFSSDPSNYIVMLHRHDLNTDAASEDAYIVKVNSIHVADNRQHEIAIWKITAVEASYHSAYPFLDDGYLSEIGTILTIAGWVDSPCFLRDGSHKTTLKESQIPLVRCPHANDHSICAGKGKRMCNTNKGGAIFVSNSLSTIIVGVSIQPAVCTTDGIPAMFASVSNKNVSDFLSSYI